MFCNRISLFVCQPEADMVSVWFGCGGSKWCSWGSRVSKEFFFVCVCVGRFEKERCLVTADSTH